MSVAGVGSVGAAVGTTRTTGSDVKSAPVTKNVASAAQVKAASPTTSVSSSAGSDARDTSSNTARAGDNTQASTSGFGANSNHGGGIAAAANVGAAASPSADFTHTNTAASNADQVDTSSPLSWLQFQDFLDTVTPTKSSASDLSENGISTPWDYFQQNVNNGSMGMPGAVGYGLDANPSSTQAALNPLDSLGSAFGGGLSAIHDFLQGPYEKRKAANGGQAPFQGPLDIQGIESALNAPYDARTAANNGVAPFEGAIDWNGMYDALQAPADARNMRLAGAAGAGVPGTASSSGSAYTPGGWGSEAFADTSQARLPADALNTGAVAPAYTGGDAAIARDRLPSGDYSAPLGAIDTATQPTSASVPLPRNDPRGYGNLFATDGQVSAPDGSILSAGTDASQNPATKPTSKWDSVVDNAGKLLSHTSLGTIVSNLFPDVWNGMGDAMKGLGDGTSGGTLDTTEDPLAVWRRGSNANGQGGSTASTGTGASTAPPLVGFVDLNHNGIDDRLEGYTGGDTSLDTGGNQFRSNRTAVFPGASYQPGFDPEWNYFHDHLARGGVVGFAAGGQVGAPDPRVMMIADAEDALHRGDHQHPSLDKFVDTFGPKALEHLNNNVRAGHRMRAGMPARQITGPGGPTDDAVPAVIDGVHPAKLSSGEVVLPVDAVKGAGDGDPRVGADRLMQLSQRLAAK